MMIPLPPKGILFIVDIPEDFRKQSNIPHFKIFEPQPSIGPQQIDILPSYEGGFRLLEENLAKVGDMVNDSSQGRKHRKP